MVLAAVVIVAVGNSCLSADCRYHLSGIFSEGDKRDTKQGLCLDLAPEPASRTRPRKILTLYVANAQFGTRCAWWVGMVTSSWRVVKYSQSPRITRPRFWRCFVENGCGKEGHGFAQWCLYSGVAPVASRPAARLCPSFGDTSSS